MKTLSYRFLSALVVLGILLPSAFLYRIIFHTPDWERNQHPLILLCLIVWTLVGLILSYLSGKQIIETLSKMEEAACRREVEKEIRAEQKLNETEKTVNQRADDKEIRAEQKQNEAEKLRLVTLEKLVSLQKENPSIEKIKELYNLLKPKSQASNS